MSAQHPVTTAPRKLILLGAGATNLNIAHTLFQKKITGLELQCITSEEQLLPSALLPGVIAGTYDLTDSCMSVSKVLERYGVQCLNAKVKAISANSKSIQLNDKHTLNFDFLSINSTTAQHRDHIESMIPGSKKNGFFVYPIELFANHWNQVCSNGKTTALRIAVIGNSLGSMEIALAVRQRLPEAAVTLITQTGLHFSSVQDTSTEAAHVLLRNALKNQRITVLQDTALACSASHVQLGCGAQLVCDIPIIALEPEKPAWLAETIEHIFFWPEGRQMDATRLIHIITGKTEKTQFIPVGKLHTYYSGANVGIAQWGQHTLQGRFAGWLKHYSDRHALQQA